MTDKDIEDIIDGLNMPKLKPPRFRNAVKRLKEKRQGQTQKESRMSKSKKKIKDLISITSPNTKRTKLRQGILIGNEDTFKSLSSNNDSQRIKNVYVIISVIQDCLFTIKAKWKMEKFKWYNS